MFVYLYSLRERRTRGARLWLGIAMMTIGIRYNKHMCAIGRQKFVLLVCSLLVFARMCAAAFESEGETSAIFHDTLVLRMPARDLCVRVGFTVTRSRRGSLLSLS